jgi:hypothetical protein
MNQEPLPPQPPFPQPDDQPNIGLNVLSVVQMLCCALPILGIILYFVWRDSKPIAAKSMLKVTLIAFAIILFLSILAFAFGFFSIFLAILEGSEAFYNEY